MNLVWSNRRFLRNGDIIQKYNTRDEHSLVKTVWNETYSRYVLSLTSWIEETSRVKPKYLRLCCWNQFKDILRRQFAILNGLQLIVIFLARNYLFHFINTNYIFIARGRHPKRFFLINVIDAQWGKIIRGGFVSRLFSSWKWGAGK